MNKTFKKIKQKHFVKDKKKTKNVEGTQQHQLTTTAFN